MIEVNKMTVGKSIERFGLWDKLDIDVSAPANQSPEQTYQEANELVCKLLKINTESGSPVTIVQVEGDIIDKRVQEIIHDLNQCTEIHSIGQFGVEIGLIAYEDAANSNEEIMTAYQLKLKQLSK